MDKRLTPLVVLGILVVAVLVGISVQGERERTAIREQPEAKRELALAHRRIAELEGHLRVCETTIAWEDSCCAIQSRCLERNAQLERMIAE